MISRVIVYGNIVMNIIRSSKRRKSFIIKDHSESDLEEEGFENCYYTNFGRLFSYFEYKFLNLKNH